MPRYLVERDFPQGLTIPTNETGAQACSLVGDKNATLGVHWVHSYVNPEHTKTWCIYDAPSPEAIRQSAELNGLPANVITEVSVLDPYFYRA